MGAVPPRCHPPAPAPCPTDLLYTSLLRLSAETLTCRWALTRQFLAAKSRCTNLPLERCSMPSATCVHRDTWPRGMLAPAALPQSPPAPPCFRGRAPTLCLVLRGWGFRDSSLLLEILRNCFRSPWETDGSSEAAPSRATILLVLAL